MMFRVRQGLTLQQSPKHPGLVRRFLYWHQVLNLTEGHHPLDPVLWASIFEDIKLSVVLGSLSWVVCIHEKLQIDQLRLVRVSPINLVNILHLGNKMNEGVLVQRRRQNSGGKTAEDLENLLMAIVWIDWVQQKCDHSALC
jgi:hypothetical protein